MDNLATLSSTAWRELSANEKFKRYMSALGLPQQQKQIEKRLEREFGKQWTGFRAAVQRRCNGDMTDDIYALKNQNLTFSLLVNSAERRELHALAYSLLHKASEPSSGVLDIGCENGFLTCLMALTWPTSEMRGFDRSKPAVDCACELASKLKLQNVTFHTGEIDEIVQSFAGRSFDLITTITTLHDGGFLPSRQETQRGNSQIFTPLVGHKSSDALRAIASLVENSRGRWFSIERCSSPTMFSAWCQALDSVGLGIDYAGTGPMTCENATLSVVVAGHNQPRPIDFNKLHGTWIAEEFNHWTHKEPIWVVRDQQAEAIFAQINPKTCIDRIIAWDGSGREVERIEVWEATAICLYYRASQLVEETRLQFRAVTDLAAMREHWKEGARSLREGAPSGARFEEFHQSS